jgi:type IV pilus assembly protein PilW
MNKFQRGFSLLEVFIALSIGLVLFAGVLSIFVGMKTTTAETSSHGELQENGRFALSLLSEDLLRQDFWGDYTGTIDLSSINPVPGAPTGECNGDGINNGTFPLADGHFRTLWGETVTNASIMGCITDAKLESDVLQLKRAVSSPEVDGAGDPITAAPAGNFYLVANINSGTVISAGAVPAIDNAQVWQYQHHVYYVREETVGDNVVPVLMQGQLGSQLTFSPVVDGIDMIRFLYGVDTDSDGIVNAFVSADNMTQGYWNRANDSRIVAVKIYVLARNVRPDLKYTNTNTYVLGDLEVEVNDNYRRLLFSSTVTLFNARLDSW